MLRLFIPILFFAIFIAWVLYRLLIKKDLKQNLNSLYLGLIFIGVWVLIYYFLLK
jgi:high-affinity Fe2+/Pb2+ permease